MEAMMFWMSQPPNVGWDEWVYFRGNMAWWFLGIVLGGAVLVMVIYTIHARLRRITYPKDLFAAYTPMLWLLLAVLGGALATYGYYDEWNKCIGQEGLPKGQAALTGLLTMIGMALLAYGGMFLPEVTPLKYRYRPRGFLYGRKGR